jgi:hypothetical protein
MEGIWGQGRREIDARGIELDEMEVETLESPLGCSVRVGWVEFILEGGVSRGPGTNIRNAIITINTTPHLPPPFPFPFPFR